MFMLMRLGPRIAQLPMPAIKRNKAEFVVSAVTEEIVKFSNINLADTLLRVSGDQILSDFNTAPTLEGCVLFCSDCASCYGLEACLQGNWFNDRGIVGIFTIRLQ
jgi:hypothetical protein